MTSQKISHFRVFSFLWAVALATHLYDRAHWFMNESYTLLTISIVLFFVLRRTWTFLTVLVVQLFAWWSAMPSLDNHWMFATFVSFTILSTFLFSFLQRKKKHAPEVIFERCLPSLRMLVALFYGCVALHKLNSSFLNPSESCVAHVYRWIQGEPFMIPLPPSIPDPVVIVMAVSTIVLFLLACIGFSHRKLWLLGIIAGVLFHIPTLSIMMHFPIVMFATYVLFIPKKALVRIVQVFNTRIQKIRPSWNIYHVLSGYITIATIVSYVRSTSDDWMAPPFVIFDRLHALIVISVLVFALIVILRQKLYKIALDKIWHVHHPALYIVPSLFVLNCLSPFLGLKDSTSMSMWSNSRTDNLYNNHLLLGNLPPLFSFKNDTVEVVETNIPILKRFVDSEELLPWTIFKRSAHEYSQWSRSVSYIRNGELKKIEDISQDEEISAPENYFRKKIQSFRTIPKQPRSPCVW